MQHMAYTARGQPFSAAAVRWSLAFAVTCTAGSKRASIWYKCQEMFKTGIALRGCKFSGSCLWFDGSHLAHAHNEGFCSGGHCMLHLLSGSIGIQSAKHVDTDERCTDQIRHCKIRSPIAVHKTITASYEPDGMTYVLREAHTTKAALNTFFL